MEIAKKILQKRLNTVFAEKTDIQIVDYTIHVDLNNTQNASVITQLATNMGTLIFFDSTVPFSAGKKIPNDVNIILANADIAVAKAEYNKYIERWEVQLTFTPDGTKKFTKYTRENINHYLVIAKDGIVIMAPQIMMEIPDGQATITAGESDGKSNTEMDFKILATELNSGPLPFPLIIIETNK